MGADRRWRRRLRRIERRHRHIGTAAFVVVLVALIVVVVVTGRPAKNCTWRYTGNGKGAFTAECVPNGPHRDR